ncbi:MAG: phage tail protein [Sphingobium sp.]
MAMLVLSAVGGIFGGPLGAAIGGMLGNAFDHAVLFKPKGREGRRITDLQLQTSSYGTQIPKLFGTIRVAGTVIWATDLRETKSKSGGGKGRPSVTTYAYSASFAVALSARPVRAIRRIWADGNLLRGAAGDFKTGVGAFRFHPGSERQTMDPLIASAQGTGRTPAHRGIAYAVFEDLALEDFGNRIPSLTFEVEADDGAVAIGEIAGTLSAGALTGEGLGSVAGFAAMGGDVGDAIAPLAQARALAVTAGLAGLRLSAAAAEAGGAVAADMLCGRANGRAVESREWTGGSVEDVPVALTVRYHDAARDFQAGVQRATRPGPGRTEIGLDMPAVLTGDDARELAVERLHAAWTGRATMTVRCGWSALVHEPGQTLAVEREAGLWRVEEREWEDMAVRLHLRRVAGAGVVPPPGVSSGVIVRQPDAPHGPTTLMLADLPRLAEGAATAPVVVAAASGGAGWRQAALFVVGTGGDAMPVGRTAPRAIIGQADAALPAGCSSLVDEVNSLSVRLLADDMTLLSAEEEALALGRNLCLLGRELIQFQRVEQTGPSRFRLSGLRRGLRGTEWAMASHDAGDAFLLLEEDRVMEPMAATGGEGEVGTILSVAAVGIGDVEPAGATIAVTGEALIPPSPVHLTARAGDDGGWTIGWCRRSRAGWRWASGGDVPLGEERERYAVMVLDGGATVRSHETDVPGWTYDPMMVSADAAAGHAGPLTIEIRQIGSASIGRAARIVIGG